MNGSDGLPGDPDFEERRLAARARLDAIDDAGKSDPYRRAWFEAVYESAGSDAAQIPWADLARIRCSPHGSRPLRRLPPARARSISAAGSATTRPRSRRKAGAPPRSTCRRARSAGRSRVFPMWTFSPPICSRPPAEWNGAFDLVHECYTLQALPDAPRAQAIAQIASFVGAGGRLVLIARARDTSGPAAGPPWPLTRDEVMSVAAHGLVGGSGRTARRSDRRQAALARGIPARLTNP